MYARQFVGASTFANVVSTPSERDGLNAIALAFQRFYTEVILNLPDGREKSLAITHLEDAKMRCSRAFLGY